MRVQDIMTKGVQTVAHTENAEAAWNLMRWKRIHQMDPFRNRWSRSPRLLRSPRA